MILPTLDTEQQLWEQGYSLVCGIDEVGRGCFAGPVVAAGVIFPPNVKLPLGIADSKLLTPKKREELEKIIKELALAWYISEISVEVINKVGIGRATQQAFHRVVTEISQKPDFIIIDAFYINTINKEMQKPIPGGDRFCASIAAASIIAKVYRDKLMVELDQKYPEYGFAIHKGYGTKFHRDALKKHGLSPLHRTSFDLQKFL